MKKDRLQNEIDFGKNWVEKRAGKMWYWESPAGAERWRRRVQLLTSHITPGMKVLELGCGPGYFTKELAKTGAEITAIDISPDFLDVARQQIQDNNVHFEQENAYALTYKDESFDTIVGSSVLHHLEIDQAVREIFRVLKKGKEIVFAEPNLLNPVILFLFKFPFVRKPFEIAPDEMPISRWSFQKKLEKIGFQNIIVKPHDFLFPLTPKPMIQTVQQLGKLAESTPIIREISGSLYLRAKKP